MLVALAHLKAEFIRRARARPRRTRLLCVGGDRERERGAPFYLSRTRIPPGADITRLRRRVTRRDARERRW